MCNPMAAAVIAQGVGNTLQSRTQNQNAINEMQAQTEAMTNTNESQMMLRDLERQRQRGMFQNQQNAFGRSMSEASPESIATREQDAQGQREALMGEVLARSSQDVPLPGSTIPGGGGGVMPQANRVVSEALGEDAENVGSRNAAMAGFGDAMRRTGEALIPGQFNIGRIGQDSRMSRALLPNELDAARVAPRIPAPESAMLGQALEQLGRMGATYAGLRAGQNRVAERQQSNQAGDELLNEFGNSQLMPPRLRGLGPNSPFGFYGGG